jgi:glyoxylase-like metal-dependent hydrolase (beta-lactamase superfamily II)
VLTRASTSQGPPAHCRLTRLPFLTRFVPGLDCRVTRAALAERARFEATDPGLSAYWKASFPGELPRTPVLPEPLTDAQFELEGQMLRAVSVGQGDTEHSTVLHVPSAAAVVGGDVVYNGVHMMTAETDEQSRGAWIASLDAVAALNPSTVVAGHKSVGARPAREHRRKPAVAARLQPHRQRRWPRREHRQRNA